MQKTIAAIGLVAASLLYSALSSAQTSWPETFLPIPDRFEAPVSPGIPGRQRFDVLEDIFGVRKLKVEKLAADLDLQFKKSLLPDRPKNCSDPNAPAYARRLLVSGELQSCADYARSCRRETGVANSAVFTIGAECEAGRYHYQDADFLFRTAIANGRQRDDAYEAATLRYAAFALLSDRESEVSGILTRSFPLSETPYWEAVLATAARLDPSPLTKKDAVQFLDTKIATSNGRLRDLLRSLRLRIDVAEYIYADGFDRLEAWGPEFEDPLLWYEQAYKIIYHAMNTEFAEARKIYDVFDRYASPLWNFPNEENTYNYTELYQSVCRNSLLDSAGLKKFDSIRKKIRNGQLPSDRALVEVSAFANRYPDRADVLTTYGALLALNDRHDEALKTYWSAHRACRYFNRANWGLTLEKRHFRYRGLPNYQDADQVIDSELANRKIPTEIATYIQNWDAFGSQVQKRIAYGARIWLPFMKTLEGEGYHSYIKFSFDLLSDSPGLSSIRDERIGGANYPNDNRLWDDVRGLGGGTVIADAAEVFNTVVGDYNLLGHEMAHQFQYLMEKTYKPGLNCITDLYQDAKQSATFPDPYSAQNKEEHFAQGVTYWLVPKASPRRFGINRSWLETNAQKQIWFIESIDRANGDLRKVRCSL